MSQCTVCSSQFDLDGEGGIMGYFGIIPVEFCPTCLSSMYDMVEQTSDKPEWEGLTDEEILKIWNGIGYNKPWSEHRMEVSRALEAKLKEKNDGN